MVFLQNTRKKKFPEEKVAQDAQDAQGSHGSQDAQHAQVSQDVQTAQNAQDVQDAQDAQDVQDVPRKRSVHWHDSVVTETHIIARLTKVEMCGTIGVDNWLHFAKIRILQAEHDEWAQRTLTLDDIRDAAQAQDV